MFMRLIFLWWWNAFISQIPITNSTTATMVTATAATTTTYRTWIEHSYFTKGDDTADLWSNYYKTFNYDTVHLHK